MKRGRSLKDKLTEREINSMQEKSDPSEKKEGDGEETFPDTGPENEEESKKKTGAGEETVEEEPETGTGKKTGDEAETGTGAETEAKTGTEENEGEKSGKQEEEIPIFSMERRLTKSRKNKILEGVCGGIGEYFDIDPTIVRLAFVVLTFFSGIGIVIYIVLAVIMPQGEDVEMAQNMSGFEGRRERNEGTGREVKSKRMRLLGAALLIIGIFLFLDRFHVFEMFWWVNKFFWPVVFTATGAWLFLRNRK